MRGTRRLVRGVLVTTGLVGCGGSMASAPVSGRGGPPSASATVTVGDNFFRSDRNRSANAAVDTIAVGGTVTWTWAGTSSAPHNVASLGMPSFTSGGVETGAGSRYELTFTAPGTYRYNCAIHGNLMTGVVVVVAQ